MKGWSFDGLVKALKSGAFIEGATHRKVNGVDVFEIPLVGGTNSLVVEIHDNITVTGLVVYSSVVANMPVGLDGMTTVTLQTPGVSWVYTDVQPKDSAATFLESCSGGLFGGVTGMYVSIRCGGVTNRNKVDIEAADKTFICAAMVIGIKSSSNG